MSTPDTTSVAPNPYAPTTAVAPAAAFDRWRWLLAGVIGILGGYLTVSSLNGGLLNLVSGIGRYEWDLAAFFISQGVFALAVASFAFLVAPGSLGRRVLAVVLYVVFVSLVVVLLSARYSGDLRLPGPVFNVLLNAYWLVLLIGALCWLIAASARPIAYLTLLLTLVVAPINYVVALNGIPSAVGTVVQLVLALVVAIVVLLVSRPAPATAAAAPVATAVTPPVTTASDLAPTAFVAMEEGAEAADKPSTPTA